MALFNLKNIKNAVQGAVDTAASAVKDSGVQDKLADLGVADKVTGLIDTAKDEASKLTEINVSDQVTSLVNTVKSMSATGQQIEATQDIPVTDALSIFYYLMAANGIVHEDELEMFNSIFNEMGDSCIMSKEDLVFACQARLKLNESSISPLIPAMACVDQTLLSANDIVEDEVTITPKLLVWNLIAIALSDGGFDDAERELVNHIARHLNINDTVLMEMESSALSINDIDREINWVKTTDRPYLVIESIVKELENRKAAAFEGVQSLISL